MRGKSLWMSMMLLAFLAVAVAPAAAQTPAPPRPPRRHRLPRRRRPPPPAEPPTASSSSRPCPAYGPDRQRRRLRARPGPDQVKQAIWAANLIVGMPYRLGGATLGFTDHAYDCSGTVSFAMHGAGLLARPRDSSSFLRFGAAGGGGSRSTQPRHAFAVIAGCGWTRARPAIPPAARARGGARTCAHARLQGPPPGWPVASARLVRALWIFLPVIGAPSCTRRPALGPAARAEAPARWRAQLRGRRIFGDNKTWRGALCMTAGVVLATVALWRGTGGSNSCRSRARLLAADCRSADRSGHGGRRAAQLVPQAPPGHRPGSRRRSAGGVRWRCLTRRPRARHLGLPAADLGHARLAAGDRLRRDRGTARGRQRRRLRDRRSRAPVVGRGAVAQP